MMWLEFALIVHLIGVFDICRVLNSVDIWILSLLVYMIVTAITHFGRVTSSTYRSYVIFSDPERPLRITSISIPFFCLEIFLDRFHCRQGMSFLNLIGTCLEFLNDLALSACI